MDPAPQSASRRSGYTLIELMMVVLIIAISVVAFAPGFSRAMADRQVSTAARELIRIGRRARSDSFGYLRAHLVWIRPVWQSTDGKRSGRVQLIRGLTNSCLLQDWATLQASCTATPVGPQCLEDVRFAEWTSQAIAMREELKKDSFGTSNRALCYAPDGSVLWAASTSDSPPAGTNLSALNTSDVRGGFVYTLHAGTENPISTDRVHRVLFPLGSTPRALR